MKSLGYCEEDEKGDEERKHKHEPRPKVKCFRDIVCLVGSCWSRMVGLRYPKAEQVPARCKIKFNQKLSTR